jgi:hypothetical protein
MKTIIKYISLLLFSGLILPFYHLPGHKKMALSHAVKPVAAIKTTHIANPGPAHSFIYQDIAEMLFPQLIN